MTSVTGYTKAKMDSIVANTIVDASVESDYHLHFRTANNTIIDAGNVRGPIGASGLAAVALTTGTDFNTVNQSGWYNSDSSSVNCPVPAKGLLEVVTDGNTVPGLIRQSYYVIDSSDPNGLQYTREYYTSSWRPWVRRNTAPFSAMKLSSSTFYPTNVLQDVPNCSVTIPVKTTSDVYKITATMRTTTYSTAVCAVYMRLYLDGVYVDTQFSWTSMGVISTSGFIPGQWLLNSFTGTGNKTVTLRALQSTSDFHAINIADTGTTLMVEQIN